LEGALTGLGELMRAAGIVQRGDPILGPAGSASAEPPLLTASQIAARQARAAARFELPREASAARSVLDALRATAGRAIERYTHQNGRGITGIAAPQIGVDRAAVIVREPGAEFVELLNPRVLTRAGLAEHYEGCLSMFDWRGLVARPAHVEVEHQDLAGVTHVTSFGPGMAGSVMHEIDHLNKVLFDEVRVPGTRLIPVEEYRAARRPSSRSGTDS
jgi:peptide deformylase